MKVILTTCTLGCFDTCSVLAHVDDEGRLVRLQGDPDHPITQGFLCHKVSKYPVRVYHKDRILHPLRRGPRGFERISWKDAIDYAASELTRLKEKHGPQNPLHAARSRLDGCAQAPLRTFRRSLGRRVPRTRKLLRR